MRASWMLIALALVAAPARAQQQAAPADSGIWSVLNLPRTVEEGRQAGIPSGSIWSVLDSLRRRQVPAEDADRILRDEVEPVKAGAPKETSARPQRRTRSSPPTASPATVWTP